MALQSISNGIRLAGRRPGLVLLVYLVNLIVALVLSIPIFSALSSATALSGFSPDLVARFDIVLWTDVLEKAGDVLIGSWAQLFWVIPVLFFWKVALSIGLVYALRDGALRSFWEGVGRYGGKAVVLGILFVLLVLVWAVVVTVVVVVAGFMVERTESAFVLYWIVTPSVAVVGLAVLDLMHDFGRISLVSAGRTAVAAWIEGIKYPFRRPGSVLLYLFWAVVSLVLSIAVTRMHASWAATMAGVWLAFLGQQIVFLLRAGTTVAWFGTEVDFYERRRLQEAPLIAEMPTDGEGFDVSPA